MKTKKLQVPKEIYVTAKEHKEYDYVDGEWVPVEKYQFAFLHPHEPNKKTDEKRKQTQLGWAHNAYKFVDGILIELRSQYDFKTKIRTYTEEPSKYQPRILSNDPLTGFEIFEVATRYSTSNKVFRVKDPRGFVTEITAKSLLGIILDGTISNGIIQDACVWQANKNLIVVKD